jgi:hypothetical protein
VTEMVDKGNMGLPQRGKKVIKRYAKNLGST